MKSQIKKNLKNIEGKRLLEKTKLGYSMTIIQLLNENYELYPELLEYLGITEEELLAALSGERLENITFYHEALNYTLKKTKKKPN